MVKKINMKGGGNEVIMIIAVLLICLLIGGAAFVLTQDDLKACPNGTTAVTDKCKCSDGHECETGKYCYDGICNASAETTSPPPAAATSTNCSDGVSTDEATCIANTDCPVFPATDSATTTGAACVWTPPTTTGGGPPPPPPAPASAAPCVNAGTCEEIGGSYVCKEISRSGTGYYQKENGSSQDADFCSLCPTFSVIGGSGVGIESCECTGGKYLQDGVCLQCGAHTVYDGSSCVCDRGENYITDGTSGNCILNTPDPGNNALTDADFTNLHPSQYNILVGGGYPNCKLGTNGCQATQANIDILNNLVVRDSDTSGWKNRDDQSIINAGMELICPDGESLTRTGNIVSCESNQCMVSSQGFAGSAVDLNNFPGVGCIETTTLNNLFSLNYDNTDISIYDANGVQQSVKDTLVGLCSDGKTCETSPTTSPNACDVLSDKVVADHSAQHGRLLFDAPGGTCQCPVSRRSSRTPTVPGSPLNVCNPSCADQDCQTQITIPNARGGPTTYDIATPGTPKDPASCMCPACINGFTNDPVTGECTVDSGTGRGVEESSAYDNGRGFCQNETKININWNENDYTLSQIKSELKNSDGEYLSRSYKSGSGHWIHECVPQEDGDPAKLLNKYNPFTRYKCEINQFLNSSGSCQELTGAAICAEDTARAHLSGNARFIGKYRKYSPECSIQVVGGTDPNSDACCESCGPHTADGPWSHPEIFDNTNSGFYNAVELNTGDANNSGVGYNTRPPLHNMVTQSEDLTLSPATAEEIKKNLFVCQKTNFTDGSGELWGGSDIGANTSSISSQTTDLDTSCQTPTNNPNTYGCQSKFNYFDSTTRDTSSERYLWMKKGNNYGFENDYVRQHGGDNTCDNINNIAAYTGFPDGAMSGDTYTEYNLGVAQLNNRLCDHVATPSIGAVDGLGSAGNYEDRNDPVDNRCSSSGWDSTSTGHFCGEGNNTTCYTHYNEIGSSGTKDTKTCSPHIKWASNDFILIRVHD